MKTKTSLRNSIYFHTFCLAFSFLMLYPVLWMVANAFKSKAEFFRDSYSLIPGQIYWENFIIGWRGFAGISFGRFMQNSFTISMLSTVGIVFSSSWVAYGFARIKFRGKKIWFSIMMLTLMLPTQVLMIQRYMIFNKLNWIDTFYPIIVPNFLAYQPFFVFLLIQFIRTIPIELDESAYVDGCNKIPVYLKIIMPNTVSALITCTIFAFYWSWDDFINPLLYLNKPAIYTVSLALRLFNDPAAGSNWGAMFAMAILSIVPIILVFFVFQRFIIEGISTQGLKG